MALITPPALVAAPGRQQLPYGLFSVLSPQSSNARWEAGGIAWEGLTTTPAITLAINCSPGTDLHANTESGPTAGGATPFTVHGYFECGSVGYSVAEAEANAEAHLLAQEQAAVERALWSGSADNVPNLSGAGYNQQGEDFPYDTPTDIGTFTNALEALSALEEYQDSNYGVLGVIHVPRHVGLRLIKEGLVETRGGRANTRLGTPVVLGSGYSGEEIRITPALYGYRSEVDSYTSDGATFDPRKNNLLAVAARNYVIGFEALGQASVTLEPKSSGSDDAPEINFPDSIAVSNWPSNQNVTVTGQPLEVTLPEEEPSGEEGAG